MGAKNISQEMCKKLLGWELSLGESSASGFFSSIANIVLCFPYKNNEKKIQPNKNPSSSFQYKAGFPLQNETLNNLVITAPVVHILNWMNVCANVHLHEM